MTELRLFLLFLFAWTFFQSLWLSRLAKRVDELGERLTRLELRDSEPER